jgi:hypothetical protein
VVLYKQTRGRYYNRDWARNLLAESGARAICFDWVRPKQYVVAALLDAGADLGIPTFALPHGVYVYTNDPITIESRPLETFDKLNKYDYVIVQNNLYKEVMSRTGLKPGKIHVMGSARYCDEWVRLNRRRSPQTIEEPAEATGDLKTVLMTTKLRYRVNAARLLETIDLLARINNVHAVVKPHTRTTKEARMYEDLPIPTRTDSSSVELCQWADVVLVIGSSIIIEPLLQGKPCLYLKYLHDNTTLYEDFGACWIINSEQELEDALLELVQDKSRVPYSTSDVDRFLADIVTGGQQDRDVLEDYTRFITGGGTGVH